MPKRAEVEAWLGSYDNPMKPVALRLREIILAADPRMDECIKWQTPTFTFQGNLASFNPKSKQHASLLFHTGAQIPGRHPRLEGTGNTARTMKIASLEEALAARAELEAIVQAWCMLRTGASSASASKPAKKAATKSAARTRAIKQPAPRSTKKKAAAKRTGAAR